MGTMGDIRMTSKWRKNQDRRERKGKTKCAKPGECFAIQTLGTIAEKRRQALARCRAQFQHYADHHAAKKTEDGFAKAAINMEFVKLCDEAMEDA